MAIAVDELILIIMVVVVVFCYPTKLVHVHVVDP